MAIDYREHKAVSKNRPRKQPAGIFFLSLFVAVITAYTLGMVTGWLVFRPARQNSADIRTAPHDANVKGVEAPAKSQNQPAEGPGGAAQEPLLTFYERLPKGNRDLMGSGLNTTKPPEQIPARVIPRQPPAPEAKEAAPVEKTKQSKEPARVPVKSPDISAGKETPARESLPKEDEGKVKYIVQVASYHERKEAEAVRDRLKADGFPAYMIESNVPEKGIFYRIRIGRHLDQKAAHEMAEKAGSGAIVIPE